MGNSGSPCVEEMIVRPCLRIRELKFNVSDHSLIHVSIRSAFLEGKALC